MSVMWLYNKPSKLDFDLGKKNLEICFQCNDRDLIYGSEIKTF